jgi:hypothetical protein
VTALLQDEQNLTSGEFQNQYEIFISSRKSGSETRFQAGIYATIGLTSTDFWPVSALSRPEIRFELAYIPPIDSM